MNQSTESITARIQNDSTRGLLRAARTPSCPSNHTWFFRMARALLREGFSDEDIAAILAGHTARPPKPGEIRDAIRSAKRGLAGAVVEDFATAPPPVNAFYQQAVLTETTGGLAELAASSPVPPSDDPAEYLARLFHPGDLVCLGKDKQHFATRPLELWLRHPRLRQLEFVVAAPMIAQEGMTAGERPHLSPRAKSNTGQPYFFVSEWDLPAQPDGAHLETQAKFILHLREYAHLLLVVHSGGKSLHAWWSPPAESRGDFPSYLVSLGSDPAVLRPGQLVRLPAGTRKGGVPQKVVFWNPEACHA